MSVHVFFALSIGLKEPLMAPAGTKQRYANHVDWVEKTLGLEREQYRDNPVHWKSSTFDDIDDKVLCETVEQHNSWVRQAYDDFKKWAEAPESNGEEITPADAQSFWHALHLLTVPCERWTGDFYRRRMEVIYEVMRGQPREGVFFDEKKVLTPKQAGEVIRLFSDFLDPGDLRLEVPRGCDYLADSDQYRWCEKCGAVPAEDGSSAVDRCRRRGCPLKKEDREEERTWDEFPRG